MAGTLPVAGCQNCMRLSFHDRVSAIAHFAVLALVQAGALAQQQKVQRALIQRDQQSEGFAQQHTQSQEKVQLGPGDIRHLNERQRLDSASGQQLPEVKPDPPPALRAYERKRAADERTFMLPPPVMRPIPLPKPAPLPASTPLVTPW